MKETDNTNKEHWITRYDTKQRPWNQKDRRPRWLFLGVLILGAKFFVAQDPYFVEELYSQVLYPLIRLLFDITIGRLGFAFVYIAVAYMLFRIFKVYIRSIRPQVGCIGRIFNFAYTTLAVLGWLAFWFMLLWGFNYDRVSLEERISLERMEFPPEYLKAQLVARDSLLETGRADIAAASASITEANLPQDMEEELRFQVKQAMEDLGYNNVEGRPRGRQLRPKGILMRFGSSGMYFPYTGEANIDAGLHPLQKPFTMAHELAHAYGIGDEGSCNFIAYVACTNSRDPFVQYSGHLIFWRYLASGYRRYDEHTNEDYVQYRSQLPKGIVTDLDEINENNAKYPDIMPRLREVTYDNFLKAQGVDGGIMSYGKVVDMVLAWELEKMN
jgi:hypothetical protein